jgi:SPX domain protein involved in polyphosphate accumulation
MACVFSIIQNSCGCIIGYNLPLQTVDNVDITDFPVTVLNVNEVDLGNADTPDEYAALWNSDLDNQAFGQLYVGPGAFCFYLKTTSLLPPSNVLAIEADGFEINAELFIINSYLITIN